MKLLKPTRAELDGLNGPPIHEGVAGS